MLVGWHASCFHSVAKKNTKEKGEGDREKRGREKERDSGSFKS